MTEIKRRIVWIDYLKGVCLVAVIMSHLGWPEVYARLLSPFYLAGFFWSSGYTFNTQKSFGKFFSIKTRTLLVPVLIFGTINAILTYIYPGTMLKDRILGILTQIPGKWDDLWFVACLYSMELIFYPIIKYIDSNVVRTMTIGFITICGVLYATYSNVHLPWQLENACVMLPFMFLGYVSRHTSLWSSLLMRLKELKSFVVIMILYISLICVYDNSPIDIHLLQYGNIPYFMFSALLGTLFAVSLSMVLERWANNRFLNMLQYVGGNTLVYYAFQSKVITIVGTLLSLCGIQYSTYLNNLLISWLVCSILVIPAECVNRFFPSIIGRKRIKIY